MIGIIDYGMGNLHSVANALAYIGEEYVITSDRDTLDRCGAIILPGVGAFPDAMERLGQLGLVDYLRGLPSDKPLLGICLGMQLLFERSFEFGEHEGLGLIGGDVVRLTAGDSDRNYKIPHMGWNALIATKPSVLFDTLPYEGAHVYFVHSFKAVPTDGHDYAAVCSYGENICAAVSRGNVYGVQFHPEKSGEKVGLVMLRDFCALADKSSEIAMRWANDNSSCN